MKYIVTATSFLRIDTNEYRFNDFVRDEVIDTKTNPLFQDCLDAFEVEDRYEEFWNRLNANYNNRDIVKVLKVIPVVDEDEPYEAPSLVA
ncbi:hypothetical protein N9Q14_03790 [Pseudomonadales bacterium]|jgi:hypothetical protein|nr:hypothetical protein [Pseudomonadales bacterium]